MARRHRRCDLAAHHVSETADERADKAVAEVTQKDIREKAGQENVDDESPRHRGIGRHDHPQQKRRIKNVAMHRRDVRHSTEQIRVPQREVSGSSERRRAELPERVAGDVLVAVRVHQESARQGRISHRQSAERINEGGPGQREARRR